MLYTPHLNDRELADYLDHLVSEEEAKRIEKHYLLCPECIHRLRALSKAVITSSALPLRSLEIAPRPRPSAAPSAPLSTITVTTTSDTTDAASGVCANVTVASLPGADGVVSLREAICAANNNAGADTIEFDIRASGAPVRRRADVASCRT